jgi:hypothetical protein
MSGDPARFLNAFAQALAAMALYRVAHPARERALDMAYQQIQDLQADTPRPLFTFLGDEVVFGQLPLRELKAWDWGKRLAQAGIQRLEFEDRVSREDFEGFLEEVLARLTLSAISTEARQMRRSIVRAAADRDDQLLAGRRGGHAALAAARSADDRGSASRGGRSGCALARRRHAWRPRGHVAAPAAQGI